MFQKVLGKGYYNALKVDFCFVIFGTKTRIEMKNIY